MSSINSLSYIKGSGWVFPLNVLNDAYDMSWSDASVVQRIRITTERTG